MSSCAAMPAAQTHPFQKFDALRRDCTTVIQGVDIEWLGHDSFKISYGGKSIYIDPFKVSSGSADLILVTHEHFDHCDAASVNELSSEGTVVVAPSGCRSKLARIITISAGEKKTLNEISIEAVPAYNTNKPYHPKGLGVGYVIAIGGKHVYHAGDTDRISEMKSLKNIDIALLPVSGTYVMTAEEAAAAVNDDIKPRSAIPMHYGSIVGSRADAERFKKLCKCEVVIM